MCCCVVLCFLYSSISLRLFLMRSRRLEPATFGMREARSSHQAVGRTLTCGACSDISSLPPGKLNPTTAYKAKVSHHLVNNYDLGDSSPRIWPRRPMRYPKRYEGKGKLIVQAFLALEVCLQASVQPLTENNSGLYHKNYRHHPKYFKNTFDFPGI